MFTCMAAGPVSVHLPKPRAMGTHMELGLPSREQTWGRGLKWAVREKESKVLRESVPRQVDRESRGPQGERGLEFSRRKKGHAFFFSFSTFLRII